MKTKIELKWKGFTLIELLVVVLIIGILSAIALPQYQLIVEKTKLMKLAPLMKSVRDAQQMYYLDNNTYTNDIDALAVSFPSGTQVDPQDEEGIRAIITLPDGGSCESVTRETENWLTRLTCRSANVSASLFVSYRTGEWRCYPSSGDLAKGKRLCKAMGCSASAADSLTAGTGCTFSF